MSSGGGGSSTPAGAISAITHTGFVNEGGGQWTLDTPYGGGQILDETGTSVDPGWGYGGKVYSAKAWDSEYNMIGGTDLYGSLNEAKWAIRDKLKSRL
jgi:hypothetical protein